MLIVEICLFIYLTLGVLNCTCMAIASNRSLAAIREMLENHAAYTDPSIPSVDRLKWGMEAISELNKVSHFVTLARVLLWPRYYKALNSAFWLLWPFGAEVSRTQR